MVVILLSNDEQRHAAEELVHRMVKRAVELEGTVTVSFPACLHLLQELFQANAHIGRTWSWSSQKGLSATRTRREHRRHHEKGESL